MATLCYSLSNYSFKLGIYGSAVVNDPQTEVLDGGRWRVAGDLSVTKWN